MNKKLIPFIPIIGVMAVVLSPAKSSEFGLDNGCVFIGSAVLQALCISPMCVLIVVSANG